MLTAAPDASQYDEMDRKVVAWLEREMGGEIVSFERYIRWRPGWRTTIRVRGELRRLHVRGPRGSNFISPLITPVEFKLFDVLERYGIPSAHAHALIDDPLSIVMDILPGHIDLSTAANDASREAVRAQYVEALYRLHTIPLAEFKSIGMTIPDRPEEVVLNLYRQSEQLYRNSMRGRRFALMEFVWLWLLRNVPKPCAQAGFVTGDAGQFMFEGNKLSGLIDFEMGYIGDPASEFAGMRVRDTAEPLGDISALMDRYEKLSDAKISKHLVEYHTVGFSAANGFLSWPLAFELQQEYDYVAYLSFSVALTRFAIEAIAEIAGVELVDPDPPIAAPIAYPVAPRHLAGSIAKLSGSGMLADYDRESARSVALYLGRSNLYGTSIDRQNRDDISRLLGKTFDATDKAEEALTAFVLGAGPEYDVPLAKHFHRWLHRQDFLLRECGSSSYMTGTKLQKIPPR
jgi:aminoglycoside phosphotransferase (APT) family kinase protein